MPGEHSGFATKATTPIGTINRSLPDWGESFGEAVVASAILDRLMHNAAAFNIKVPPGGDASEALTTAANDPTKR